MALAVPAWAVPAWAQAPAWAALVPAWAAMWQWRVLRTREYVETDNPEELPMAKLSRTAKKTSYATALDIAVPVTVALLPLMTSEPMPVAFTLVPALSSYDRSPPGEIDCAVYSA